MAVFAKPLSGFVFIISRGTLNQKTSAKPSWHFGIEVIYYLSGGRLNFESVAKSIANFNCANRRAIPNQISFFK